MTSDPEKVKKILSDAFTEYRRAYRTEEREGTFLPPRDKYPDIVSYQTAKVMEYLKKTPTQISQLRKKLELALVFYEDALFNASAGAVSEALTLLPCETCNGTGEIMTTFTDDLSGGKYGDIIPCPDCQS